MRAHPANILAAVLATLTTALTTAQQSDRPNEFNIAAGDLADALDRFSEQSGLQVVYDHALLKGLRATPVAGAMQAGDALNLLLAHSGLSWAYANDITVVLTRALAGPNERGSPAGAPAGAPGVQGPPRPAVADLGTYVIFGHGESSGLLPVEAVDSVFGFDKSLLETPRSISVITDDVMASYGIDTTLDVSKIVPGTYTPTIFGINGNVNIRSVSSDTYFRGMKRIENTQMFPAPMSSMSRIDVVRGPPSPLYGPGKAGGYINVVPKSARADTGAYLEAATGKIELDVGSYDEKALRAEVGGPLALGNEHGGYYVYASLEDSNTYYDNVPFRQSIVQSSFDFELSTRLRTELGQMYQHWTGTELTGWNRVTQQLIDTGMYEAGRVQLDMDRNGDGLISRSEIDSYGPLIRSVAPGTPAATVAALLGPGWTIDPATERTVKLSRSANAQSPEDGAGADVNLGYLDLIWQLGRGAQLTDKSYFESMRRYKWTRATAFAHDTASSVFENKLIYEQPVIPLPGGFGLQLGASASYRHYDTQSLTDTAYGDLFDRVDLSLPFDVRNRFAVPPLEPDLAPWNTGLKSVYDTTGAGLLADLSGRRLDVILGARYDRLSAHSSIPDFVLTTPGLRARGHDGGLSWSASASYQIAPGLRPYFTYSTQQTLIHGVDGGIPVAIVAAPLSASEMREVGIKWTALEEKLFAAVSAYRQTLTVLTDDTMQVPATLSRGLEAEVHWAPSKRFGLTGGWSWQRTVFDPPRPATILVNPSFFGLGDGYYGGRLQTTLTSEPQYAVRAGYPPALFYVDGTLVLTRWFAVNVSANHQQDVRSGRAQDIRLPSATVVDLAVVCSTPRWTLRLSVDNLTNTLYFIPDSPDFAGEVSVLPAPERNFRASIGFEL